MSEQQAQGADAAIDLNNELKSRREKLAALREQGIPFPNDFRRDHTSDQLHADFDAKENEELEALNVEVSVAGRMMTRRIMGKASFVTLQDVGGRIQLYVARDDLPEGVYNEQFKKWGPRRYPRGARQAVQNQNRRALYSLHRAASADQSPAPAAGQIPRPAGSGSALSPALPGSDLQR
ncbi:Lysine--tRNA ligase [Raoultella terrigena]|uniref:lysine--tRNA ligase n=1 Tax=Raoultella terrigena TaxID=577 RepID=A0A485CGV4_RAOTE|nr:Lysine--tRNA ligase [Raoultella terrigena]